MRFFYWIARNDDSDMGELFVWKKNEKGFFFCGKT